MLKPLISYFTHPPSLIAGSGFLSLSLLMSTWGTRLPDLKQQLLISDGQIGIALLVFSLGALLISPFATFIMDRFPTGKITFVSVVLQTCFYILPFLAYDYLSFLVSMLTLGVANGFINITINATAAIVEKEYQRSILSTCHSMFSIGAIFGAVSAGWIAELDVSPFYHMMGLIFFILIVNLLLIKTWWKVPNTDLKAPAFALPKASLLGLFTITFCIVLAELTIMDWSAVYLKDTLNSPAALTGLGFAGFSFTMAIGRLLGDTLVLRLGRSNIIVYGCLTASIGLGIAASTGNTVIAIMGFTLSGIGMAVIVPLIYSLSAKMKNISPGLGIASIATACVLAGLVGRPLVGLIADFAGMSWSMLIACSIALMGGLIGLMIRKSSRRESLA